MQIAPKSATVDSLSGTAGRFVLPVQPWSVNILQLHLGTSPSSNTGSSGESGSLLSGGGHGASAIAAASA